MNKNFIPTPQDEACRMEASSTKTANFNGTAYDNGPNFAPGGAGLPVGMVANVTACDRADGNETYTFTPQESADNATWTACGPSITVDVTGTTATLGAICAPAFISTRYTRLNLVVAGTTPSITYEVWQNANIR